MIVDEFGEIPRGLFDLLPNLDNIEGIEGIEAAGEEFGRYVNEAINNVALDLYMSGEKPDRAWVYQDENGLIFLAQCKDRGEAYRIMDDAYHQLPTSAQLKRCRAMDDLGYTELWGLYAGVVNAIPCANPSCEKGIYISGTDEGSQSGVLVDAYGFREPIAVGTDVYCSRECRERR